MYFTTFFFLREKKNRQFSRQSWGEENSGRKSSIFEGMERVRYELLHLYFSGTLKILWLLLLLQNSDLMWDSKKHGSLYATFQGQKVAVHLFNKYQLSSYYVPDRTRNYCSRGQCSAEDLYTGQRVTKNYVVYLLISAVKEKCSNKGA